MRRSLCEAIEYFRLTEAWNARLLSIIESHPIATNLTKDSPQVERKPGEPFETWLARSYEPDIVGSYIEKKAKNIGVEAATQQGKAKSVEQAAKQLRAHKRLTTILDRIVGEHAYVAAPGSGLGHEQAIDPQHEWHGLEYQKNNVDGANERNHKFNVPNAKNEQWSVYHAPGRTEAEQIAEMTKMEHQPASELHHDWDARRGQIPEGNTSKPRFMYLKHACGGITDSSIDHAAKHGYDGIVMTTCCSNRYAGLSNDIIGKDAGIGWDEHNADIKASANNETEAGVNAQKRLDRLRAEFLKKRGYSVRQGWFKRDETKKKTGFEDNEPKGGFVLAVRSDKPHLVANLHHPDLLKGIPTTMDEHHPLTQPGSAPHDPTQAPEVRNGPRNPPPSQHVGP